MSSQSPLPEQRGVRLLSLPAWNKGTAFTSEERTRLGLHGLLPPYVETLEEQVERAYKSYLVYEKEMNLRIYLRQLQDDNEVLFYRLLFDHIEEMTPIVYTPAARAFTEPIVREMARKTARPIIFPLSNPTEPSEASAEDLIRWTDGRALVASGSLFAPVTFNGKTFRIAQCNNIYIFPAVGLGAIAAQASRISDSMMQAAALSPIILPR